MANINPNDFTRIADILDAMNEANIEWPDDLRVGNDRISFRYELGD